MQTQKPSVKLEDWAVVPGPNSGSYQALRPGNFLVGRAFGHQRIEKGKFIFTSPIVRVDPQQRIVETKNTCYSLGEASHEYKAWSREQGQRRGCIAGRRLRATVMAEGFLSPAPGRSRRRRPRSEVPRGPHK